MGYKKKGTHMKKGSGFKMGGMHFGNQDPNMVPQGPLMKNIWPPQQTGSPDDYDEMKDSNQTSRSKKRNKFTISSKLKDEGEGIKTKTGINLFGQKRDVRKHYDPKTGEYLGKEVTVTKRDGSKKMYGAGLFQGPEGKQDVKIKTPNPGFGITGGVGKFRQKKGYFDKPDETVDKKTTTDVKKPGRVEFAGSKPELKKFVKTDPKTKKKSLASYKEAWDDASRWETFEEDGVKKRRAKHAPENVFDDATGYEDFEKASKKYWSDMAGKTKNEELRRDTQSGKMDPPMKKKRGYKMNSPLKNYKKGYYGVK
jgi:hypothetical protein